MKKTIYFHIGTARTGTTYLQEVLDVSHNQLKDCGVLYDHDKSVFGDYLMDVCPAGKGSIKFFRMLFNETYQKQPLDKIFIIAEGLSGNSINGHSNVGAIAKDLNEITTDFDVKIILFLRSQDTYIESLYYQKIKEGWNFSFKEFIGMLHEDNYHWDRLVKSYTDVFGTDNVFVFSWELAKGKVLEMVGNVVGFKVKPIQPKMVNAALSKKGIALMKACLSVEGINQEDKLLLREFFQNNFHKQPYDGFDLLSDGEREKILKYYKKSNEVVFKQLA